MSKLPEISYIERALVRTLETELEHIIKRQYTDNEQTYDMELIARLADIRSVYKKRQTDVNRQR